MRMRAAIVIGLLAGCSGETKDPPEPEIFHAFLGEWLPTEDTGQFPMDQGFKDAAWLEKGGYLNLYHTSKACPDFLRGSERLVSTRLGAGELKAHPELTRCGSCPD